MAKVALEAMSLQRETATRIALVAIGHNSKAMSAHVGKEALAKAARSLPEI